MTDPQVPLVGPQASRAGPKTHLAGPQTSQAGLQTPLVGPYTPLAGPKSPSDPNNWPFDPLVGQQIIGATDGWTYEWMDIRNISPFYRILPLPCYPLRLHNIKGAGPWKRWPHES